MGPKNVYFSHLDIIKITKTPLEKMGDELKKYVT